MTEIKNRNSIVEKNLGLVHSCVKRFKGRGVEYDDLFQAGCVGLIKAADNFDESRGFSFSTYAVPVILGEMKRVFRDGGTVKVGRAIKDKSRIIMKKKDEIAVELGREPTVSEISEIIGIDVAETAMLLNASLPALSLTSGEEGESQFDIPVDSPENEISDFIALRQVVDSLEERDKNIIELRYKKGLTQQKTADILGMSQVQISRREKVILEFIRKKLLQ
ncbi:MAG: sigma-70 family RNA polymerase sigma factor [Clostridia bacterium]|nr:sigma-70 family RNA polymerase sigma factor [Clostridia bacterium]MBR3819850.1 sigma-70 family RNA polymerase sigma factor [Clostridia bacterium]